MKQFSYKIKTEAEVADCLARAQAEAERLPHVTDVLVMAFLRDGEIALAVPLRSAVREVFPAANFFATCVAIGVADGRLSVGAKALGRADDGMIAIVTIQFFEGGHAKIFAAVCPELLGGCVGQRFVQEVAATPDVRAAQIFLTDYMLDFQSFSEAISEAAPDIVIFGGWTGCGMDSEQADADGMGGGGVIVVNDDQLPHGIAVILYAGADLAVSVHPSFGWKPLGHAVTVTRMDAPDRLAEIDDKPASHFFMRYLGADGSAQSFHDLTTFPVCLERHGVTLARHVRAFYPDGSVWTGGDLVEGDRIRLAYGDPFAIVGEAMFAHARLYTFQPEALMAVSCIGRQSYLQDGAEQEFSLLRQTAPLAGFYSYGELVYSEGHLMMTNLMLVAVGMREGAPKAALGGLPTVPQPVFQKQTSIIAHLVHFIGAITEEWEEAHTNLLHFAERDDLTGLMNRRMLEHELERVLPEAVVANRPLSLLMLDLDYFKGINDTYGHAMGDRALKGLADVLKKCTRVGSDMPSRWGGDEFIVILGGADHDRARTIADRIRAEVKALEILPDGKHFTSSCGIATAGPADTPETMFKRVDRALYKAKSVEGKGSVASA